MILSQCIKTAPSTATKATPVLNSKLTRAAPGIVVVATVVEVLFVVEVKEGTTKVVLRGIAEPVLTLPVWQDANEVILLLLIAVADATDELEVSGPR